MYDRPRHWLFKLNQKLWEKEFWSPMIKNIRIKVTHISHMYLKIQNDTLDNIRKCAKIAIPFGTMYLQFHE